MASVTDPTGTTGYAFDALSRITGVTTPQGTVNYSYNDANQRTSMSLPGSRSVSYNYDTTGRLASLTGGPLGAVSGASCRSRTSKQIPEDTQSKRTLRASSGVGVAHWRTFVFAAC